MSIQNFIRCMSSMICGFAGFLWGSLDGLLAALIVFMILDYLTGIAVGIMQKQISSKTGFIGLLKKGIILAIAAVGHILDTQIFGGDSSLCRSAVIGFYLANEGISILENAAALGIPLPEFLIQTLHQLKDKKE